MWSPELLKALATGIATAIGTIVLVGSWLWKFSKSLERIPELDRRISEAASAAATATREAAAVAAVASREAAGIAAEALRNAAAAHRRIDELREKHDAVRTIVTTLEERTKNQGEQVKAIADQIMGRLDTLEEKLDGVIAGRN
jgi:tetrahydromethanopterin S-methyltransferase subunit G